MDNPSVEIQKRDSYWNNNLRTHFSTLLYKNSVQREEPTEGRRCKTTGGTCSCPETSDSERGHCSCNQ